MFLRNVFSWIWCLRTAIDVFDPKVQCFLHTKPASVHQFDDQNLPVEKQQSAERLILRRWRDAPIGGQPSWKRFDLVFSHLQGMTFSVKEDKALDPGDVGPFRFEAVVLETDT
jgi:hypothetical protein